MPPAGYLNLRGFTVGGTFLRGVFEKVGTCEQAGSHLSADCLVWRSCPTVFTMVVPSFHAPALRLVEEAG